MKTQTSNSTTLASWRFKGMGILRIVFGLVWAIDAWFKWLPDFINNFTSYLTGPLDSQPASVQACINFWINILKVDPPVFAHAMASGETAIAITLIAAAFSNLTYLVGL